HNDVVTPQKNTETPENPETEENIPESENQGNKDAHITHIQREITEVNFYTEVYAYMSDKNIKTAVIFRNVVDFLNASPPEILRKYRVYFSSMEFGDYKTSDDNIIIMLHNNDVSNSADLSALASHISNAGLSNIFLESIGCGTGLPVFNRQRCFYIGLPDIDEILYMLRYLKIVGNGNGKFLRYSQLHEDKIAEQILFFSRNDKNRKCTLFNIKTQISEYMNKSSEKNVGIKASDISVIYESTDISHKDPLEELNKEGWEKVYKRFSSAEFKATNKNTDDDSTEKDVSLDILRVTEETEENPKSIPHFVFEGNPGVGKSTIARLIGQILHNAGYLKIGHTVEVSGNTIIGQHIGETPEKVTKYLDDAEGGVLFIDEAHNLYVSDKNQTNANANYRKEAITTIVQAMTDKRRHFCLILAGYALSKIDAHDGVRALFDMDPGLESRFKGDDNIILIEDYKPALLQKIFISNLEKKNYKLSKEVEEHIENWITTKYQTRDRRKFANARTAENWCWQVIGNAQKRDINSKTILVQDFPAEDRNLLTEERSQTINDIFREIDEKYVGFEFMKDLINIQDMTIKEYKIQHGDITGEPPRPRHMIFRGNPGTGKTTGARLLMDFFRISRIMGGRDVIMVNAFSLLQHDAVDILREKIDIAKDKDALLFIDEAHNLHGNPYGETALRSMLNPMTEEKFTVIFAVYTSQYENFMSIDPGIESRVQVIDFPDYNDEQLFEIMKRMLLKQNREMINNCQELIKILFKNWYDTRDIYPDFGNARAVERLIENMESNRKKRLVGKNIPETERFILTYEDIPAEYREIISTQKQNSSLDDVMKRFEKYVGLEALKQEIIFINNQIQFNKRCRKNSNFTIAVGHYAFTGNPGTGKTTAGKLFASALYAMGALKTANFTKISAKDLIAGYVGQTSIKTAETLKKAINGVLLIDEAYALASDPDSHNSGSSFKEDSVNEILQFMEDRVNNSCIIFAGYTNDIKRLKKSNPGFESLIASTIEFPDYTVDECVEILSINCQNNGYTISDDAVDKFRKIIETEKHIGDFGNARTVRNMFDKFRKNQNSRIVNSNIDFEENDVRINRIEA
ncbi:MAG: AAA family ATPase, partial [Ruminococcus sp.]|nr:AAA family ATPase [Ruminococcus sp.]